MSLRLPTLECPKLVRDFADRFKDVVGSHYPDFVSALCANVMGISGLSDMARFLAFSRSVSSLSRFFNSDLGASINRRHRKQLRIFFEQAKERPEDFLWVIDDTILPHYSEKMWGSYRWYNHSTLSFCNGHKLLVVGLVHRKKRICIPVIWQMLHLKKDSPELYCKATEVALDLLRQLEAYDLPKLTVVADSWFAGETMYQGLHKAGYAFVFECRQNRTISHFDGHIIQPRPIRITDAVPAMGMHRIFHRKKMKWAGEAQVRLRGCDIAMKAVAIHNVVDQTLFAIYLTNELAWNASTVWSISRDRWAIEVHFRELKGIFTLGGAAVRSQNAVEIAISLSMIALTVIRLQQQSDGKKNQDCRPLGAGAIAQQVQLNSLHRSISKLVSPVTSQKARQRVLSKLHPQNLRRKPTERSYYPETLRSKASQRKTG